MFEAQRILLVPLLEIEHPTATIRLCDGGFFVWPGRGTFVGRDETYGTVGSLDMPGEAIGDEAQSGRLTLLPPSSAAAVALAQADAQWSPIRLWFAEADPDTGLLMSTPELRFLGLIDTISISLGRGTSEVLVEFVADTEKLFMIAEGNVLSQAFHQRAWPGELGFAHTTGTVLAVPWGVTGPARGTTYSGGGGGGGDFFAPWVRQA